MTGPTTKPFAGFDEDFIELNMDRPVFATSWISFHLPGLFFIGFLAVFFPYLLRAQADTSVQERTLPEATVRAALFQPSGYAVWRADSLPGSAILPLSTRLFWENAADVRLYAPGTLATVSLRGAGPGRSAILWNGLNLQSPMNGVFDASLLPLWPGDRLECRLGGYSAVAGSGAVGGVLTLESKMNRENPGWGGGLGYQAGSFGQHLLQGQGSYHREGASFQLRGIWQRAKNNFPFQAKDLTGHPVALRQQNNALSRGDIQLLQERNWSGGIRLHTAVWLQDAFRQIPPALTEAVADTWQADRSFRWVSHLEIKAGPRSRISGRAAWLDENIRFHIAGNTEESRSKTALVMTGWQQKFKRRGEWQTNWSIQNVQARADGYRRPEHWYGEWTATGNLIFDWKGRKNERFSALLRQEWRTDAAAPFTWTLGAALPLGKVVDLEAHVSRNFNYPTMNDRFWETLSNNTLQPEYGYSGDMGWKFKYRSVSFDLRGYFLSIDDWILWSPGADGIFRPANLRKVIGKGLEWTGAWSFNSGGLHWKMTAKGQYSETKNRAVYGGDESALGKQLPYTPNISGSGSIWCGREEWSLVYLHQFTGKRFVNTDQSEQLNPYHNAVFAAQYVLKYFKKRKNPGSIRIDFTLDNAWNTTFMSLANRPMPGRSLRAGFLLQW